MHARTLAIVTAAASLTLGGCAVTLSISPAALPVGIEGTPYSQALAADADAAFWQVVAGRLPAGLALSERSGVLAGTPQAAGEFTFTVRASAGVGSSGEITYTLTILEKLEAVVTLDTARVNTPFSGLISATGGAPPYTYSVQYLPAGISLDPTTGVLSGTPTEMLTDTWQVTVTDSGSPRQTDTTQVAFVVRPAPVRITTATLPDATVGQTDYQVVLQAEGGTPPFAWTASGASLLQAGLELVPETGILRNYRNPAVVPIPDRTDPLTFNLTVTDSDSPATTDTVELTVEFVQPAG